MSRNTTWPKRSIEQAQSRNTPKKYPAVAQNYCTSNTTSKSNTGDYITQKDFQYFLEAVINNLIKT